MAARCGIGAWSRPTSWPPPENITGKQRKVWRQLGKTFESACESGFITALQVGGKCLRKINLPGAEKQLSGKEKIYTWAPRCTLPSTAAKAIRLCLEGVPLRTTPGQWFPPPAARGAAPRKSAASGGGSNCSSHPPSALPMAGWPLGRGKPCMGDACGWLQKVHMGVAVIFRYVRPEAVRQVCKALSTSCVENAGLA